MGSSHRPPDSLVLIDDLELRAMLTATLLENLHPVAHRFVTHELLESLLDTIFIYLDSLDLDKH